eukprot:GHVR01177892.1.p1 GENE.GHVR01177892.1~~GHVR01177892.1.p1  ORF type:complete len:164 (+),score=60.52 GHVR01177892.1:71-562(+)
MALSIGTDIKYVNSMYTLYVYRGREWGLSDSQIGTLKTLHTASEFFSLFAACNDTYTHTHTHTDQVYPSQAIFVLDNHRIMPLTEEETYDAIPSELGEVFEALALAYTHALRQHISTFPGDADNIKQRAHLLIMKGEACGLTGEWWGDIVRRLKEVKLAVVVT